MNPGYLPIAASDLATRWDWLYDFLIGLSIFFTILVLGAMIWFAIAYRRRPGLRTKYITDHHGLELLWTAIPTVLLLGIFVWGYAIYSEMATAPANAIEIRVVAQQWKWNFQYEDGKIISDKFYAPMNQPVKMIMTSQDVLHAFSVPNFRIKSDIVPGMYTTVWFEAKVPGRHQVYCTAYCGANHSLMLADAYVLTDQQWADFKRGKEIGPLPDAHAPLASNRSNSGEANSGLSDPPAVDRDEVSFDQAAPVSLVAQGKQLVEAKACASCHAEDAKADNSQLSGPSFVGLYGSKISLDDGTTAVIDDNYLRESIENPAAKIRKGFRAGQMPPYQGQVSESDLSALIAYIRSLK